MKKLLFLFAMLMAATGAWADVEVEVDGLRFSVSTGTVPVTAKVIAPAEGVYTGEITIPSSINYNGEDIIVDFINSDAFANATITKVTIPSTVYFIGARAFYHCENLSEITLPEGLREISVSVFAGCPFTSLTLPGTLTRIDSYGLEGLSSLQKLTFAYSEEKLSMDGSVFNGTNNIIELVIDRDYSFGNNTSISTNTVKKVTFGEHVTKIPEYACYDMTLEELNISANVTAIGLSAFMGCTLPEGYNFPFAQIKEIESGGFYVCKNLPANIDLTGVEKIEDNAFNNSDVQIVKLGSNLTTFGECVFQYCRSLTTLNIPGTIDNLQSWWFYECTKLTNVTFDYGSTALTLEDGTFNYATNITVDRKISGTTPFSTSELKKVALGSHMSSTSNISALKLSQYTSLEELELLEGFTTVPEGVFKNLASVTTLILPEGLEFIYANAFEAIGISAVTIPGTMKTIDRYAFRNCPNLTSVTLEYSENLTDGHWNYGKGNLYLNGSAFIQTNVTDFVADRPFTTGGSTPFAALKRATLGSHVTTIPERMFAGLTLEQLVVSENVTEVVKYAFTNCNLPEGVVFPFSNLKTIGNDAFRGCTNLPATINMQDIEEIGSSAFESNTNIQSLSLGSKLTTIGSQAFANCSNLTSLTIADGALTEIGIRAFQSCNIGTFNMPRSITIIGSGAFNNNVNLTIPNNLPEGLLEIGSSAFNKCKKLNVTIPSTVTKIEQGAFSGCESLTELTIPAGVTYLNMSTFSGCTGLTQIVIPGTLTKIGTYDFDCPNVTDVTIEYGEEPISMNDVAFGLNPHFTNVYIDRDFKWLSNRQSMFGNSENITFGPHVTAIPEKALYDMSNMKSVTMTDNVKSIGQQAFYRGKSEKVTLSKNLETLDKWAFMAFRWSEPLVLPITVKEIGEAAFGQFRSWGNTLTDVYVPWLTPLAIEDDEPEDTYGDKTRFAYADNQTLWVPGGTMDAYKEAPIWKKFKKFEFWSFVVTADVAGKGQLDLANGEEVTDNGTNTALSLTGAKLVAEGAGEAVRGLFVREKDLVLAGKPARGYELGGVIANGEAIAVANDTAIVANLLADQEIHGTFTPIIYNITYNNLLNSTLPEGKTNPATYIVEDADIKLVNPERIGYTFEGWTGTDLEGAQMEVVIPFNSIGDREYTATWKPIVYPITYDLAGGSVASANPAEYTIETPDFILTNPTKLGYTFTGWEGTDLTEKTLEVTVTTGHYGDRSYTATWEPNPYKVAFNANNGEGTMAEMNFLYDAAQNLSANTFTRTGYIFAGWNSKADGTGTAYTDGEEVINLTAVRDEVVTMYAQWTPIHYQVAFDANLGTGTMDAQTFTYDAAQALTQNTFERRGYTFEGWNSQADGKGTAYADKAEVVNLSAEQDAIVTMYAQWKVIVYAITYDLAGGTVATANPEEYTVESDAITLVNPTQEGYTFMGWTGTDLTDVTEAVTIAKGSIGNRSYTAVWNVNQYTITFDTNGGTDVEAITQDYNSAITAPEAPTRDGYTFKGWNPEIPATMPAGDMTVTAQWELNVYSITYDLAGGELAPGESNPEEYTIESDAITLKNPTKKYYTFAGWTGTDLTEPTETVAIAKGSFGDRSYTATWEVAYILGDINGDGTVDVSDYIGVANHIMGLPLVDFNEMAADVDSNGTIDVSDYIGVANIILTGNVNGTQQSRATRHENQRKAASDTDLTAYDNVIYVAPQTIEPSETATTITLSICMKNTADIRGFQFDMYLPDGVTAKKNAKGKIQGVAFNADRLPEDDEHTITLQTQADGAIRFLVGSMYDETFTGNDGELMTMEVEVAAYLAEGDYPIVLKAMKLTETDISKFYEAAEVQTTLTVTTTTGISAQWASLIGKPVYDLRGLKVADEFNPKRLPAGVYIVEGRKVVVKK